MDRLLEDLARSLFAEKIEPVAESPSAASRQPVHVVYGGADLFKADTPAKLGRLALRSLETYAPDIVSFANAMWLRGADSLPIYPEVINELETDILTDPARMRAENPAAWFAWNVKQRVIEKLTREPVEDFRIDFEDGYGLRSDEEEDAHALVCAEEFAAAMHASSLPAFSGIRIKSFQQETFARAVRTLDLFMDALLARTSGRLPDNFVVTLPKIRRSAEVEILSNLLAEIESAHSLALGRIGIEVMVETPDCIFSLRDIVAAGEGRVTSAHFGAFDYTAALGITANHQHLLHEACVFARQMMQASLAPLGVRLSDSVTTEMPVPVHRGDNLTALEMEANRRSVHMAWRKHFNNVTHSLINGFYQSWDLHPAQLVARYAALTAFFLEGAEEQGARLRSFIGKATQATLSGSTFDDAATAQGCLNFFSRAVSSGAMNEREVLENSGLTADEVSSGSFQKIIEGRNTRKD